MHLLFVDESGTPPKPGVADLAYFVIVGIVIPEDRWMGLRDKFVGLKAREKYRGEVKWRYFAPNTNDATNPMRKWSQEKKESVSRAGLFDHNRIKVLPHYSLLVRGTDRL